MEGGRKASLTKRSLQTKKRKERAYYALGEGAKRSVSEGKGKETLRKGLLWAALDITEYLCAWKKSPGGEEGRRILENEPPPKKRRTCEEGYISEGRREGSGGGLLRAREAREEKKG